MMSSLTIALYEPEIPPNTGNIIRLCANTGSALALIEPLGFPLDDAKLRRAGLDYHEYASLRLFPDYAHFQSHYAGRRLFFCTTKATRSYHEVIYQPGDVFLFGPESRGLPPEILETAPLEQKIRIPMRPDSRSLNLSNAAAVIVYEAWRQLGFEGAEQT
jgi:tRNA (cytidine/uridine-2'-O-)-methyltransferase